MKKVARFQLRNEMKDKYWKEEEERKCRLCGREAERWEHMLERWRGKKDDRKERGIHKKE